jgi:hypothetical protein
MADRTPAEAREWLALKLAPLPELNATHRQVEFFNRIRSHVAALPDDAPELLDLVGLMTRHPGPEPDRYPVVPIDGGDEDDVVDVLMEVLSQWEQDRTSGPGILPGEEPPEPGSTDPADEDEDVGLNQADPAEFIRELIRTAQAWLRTEAANSEEAYFE